MPPLVLGLIYVIILLILVFNHVPIAFAFAMVGFAGLALTRGLDGAFMAIATTPYQWTTMSILIPLPLFVLMGQAAYYTGISTDLYDAAYKWVGRVPGGLAIATNVAATAFGACCGSGIAGAAAFSSIAYPEMRKMKYDDGLATACITAGGGLASLIPPSVAFIILGYLTNTSISRLFIAGIFPGILLSFGFIITIFVMCLSNPRLGPRGKSFSFKEMLISLRGTVAMLVLFFLVMGTLYLGVCTPNEASAFGAVGALAIGLVMRRLTFNGLVNIAKDTLRVTCFFTLLIVGANIFNILLGTIGVTLVFSKWVAGLDYSPYLILFIIMLPYIPLGMFMDVGAIILLTIPIIFTPLVNLGFDPLLVNVLVVILGELGGFTPPIGIAVFVVHQMTKVPLGKIFRGIVPFCLVVVAGLVIIAAFPEIAYWLPYTMRGH
jgi:C4-dicarboxylate transporter DctM subunit